MMNEIRAFDFTPSFSDVLMDHWRRFDPDAMRRELAAAAEARPERNAVRITHSYDAYLRDPRRYLKTWQEMLSICDGLGLKVVAALFNRWHDPKRDAGGIYLESFVPGLSWAFKESFYAQFLTDLCGDGARDGRIAIWQSCVKPFGAYQNFDLDIVDNLLYERRWLRELYCYIHKMEVLAPVGLDVQDWFDEARMQDVERACDVLIVSPYPGHPERSDALLRREIQSQKPIVRII